MIETYDYKYQRGETLVDKPYQTIYCATTKFTPKDYVIINILEKNNHVTTVSKQILEHSLMNVMQIDETINNLAIITKKRDGEPFEKYINQHSFTIDERIHYGFEYLKRLCNYEDLPTAIKYSLVQADQVLIQGNIVVMEEIIKIDEDMADKSFKDTVRSIAGVLRGLLTDTHIDYHLSPRCKDFIDRMEKGQHHYQQFSDILHDYKRLFVFSSIPEIEKTQKAIPVAETKIPEQEVSKNANESPEAEAEVIDIYIGTTPEEEKAAISAMEKEKEDQQLETLAAESLKTETPKVEPAKEEAIKVEKKPSLQPMKTETSSAPLKKSTVKDEIKVAPSQDDMFADTMTMDTSSFSKELTSKIDEVLDESSHIFDEEPKDTLDHEQADVLSDQAFEEYINKTSIADYDLEALEEETKYMPSLSLDEFDDSLPLEEDDDDDEEKEGFSLSDKHKKIIKYIVIAATIGFLLWGVVNIGMAFTASSEPPVASFNIEETEDGRLIFRNTSKTFGLGNSITEYDWKLYHKGELQDSFQVKNLHPSFKSTKERQESVTFTFTLRVKDTNGTWSEVVTQDYTVEP